MKLAIVNGQEISEDAIQFELARLIHFYKAHGLPEENLKANLESLREKAREQAIGAKLLLDEAARLEGAVSPADVDREVEKVVAHLGGAESFKAALDRQHLTEEAFRKDLERGVRVNRLVEQACSSVPEPTEEEIVAFFEAERKNGETQTLVDRHDQIRDLLRHEARGRAVEIYVEELREKAHIEYVDHVCDKP